MSKQKVISVLDKKINNVDNDGRKIEKEFTKGGGNLKDFID